jgi:hypothetical protein
MYLRFITPVRVYSFSVLVKVAENLFFFFFFFLQITQWVRIFHTVLLIVMYLYRNVIYNNNTLRTFVRPVTECIVRWFQCYISKYIIKNVNFGFTYGRVSVALRSEIVHVGCKIYECSNEKYSKINIKLVYQFTFIVLRVVIELLLNSRRWNSQRCVY